MCIFVHMSCIQTTEDNRKRLYVTDHLLVLLIDVPNLVQTTILYKLSRKLNFVMW
jgi:hypothetical protein